MRVDRWRDRGGGEVIGAYGLGLVDMMNHLDLDLMCLEIETGRKRWMPGSWDRMDRADLDDG